MRIIFVSSNTFYMLFSQLQITRYKAGAQTEGKGKSTKYYTAGRTKKKVQTVNRKKPKMEIRQCIKDLLEACESVISGTCPRTERCKTLRRSTLNYFLPPISSFHLCHPPMFHPKYPPIPVPLPYASATS